MGFCCGAIQGYVNLIPLHLDKSFSPFCIEMYRWWSTFPTCRSSSQYPIDLLLWINEGLSTAQCKDLFSTYFCGFGDNGSIFQVAIPGDDAYLLYRKAGNPGCIAA